MSPLMATHIEHPQLRPFKPGITKDAVETFLFRLPLHPVETGETSPAPADAAGQDGRRGTQVFDAGIGAGADEDAVDRDIGQLLPGAIPILISASRDISLARIALARRIGTRRQSAERRQASCPR